MRDSEAHDRGEELISQSLGSPQRSEELANDLLVAFQSGYPLHNLRRLLNAEDAVTVATGMWIASELGAAVRPLFQEIVKRLHHPAARVRFFALDLLTSCAGPEDENALNSGLDKLDDPDQGVRWKALVFLATMSEAALRTLRDLAMRQAPAGPRARGLQLMLSVMASRDVEPVTQCLLGHDTVLHRYAAAVAVRMAHQDSTPLRVAMASQDTTIRQFAKDMAARAGISAAAPNG
jgi:hypothetical protein